VNRVFARRIEGGGVRVKAIRNQAMSAVSEFVQRFCIFRRNCVPILFAIFSLPVFVGVAYFVLQAEQDAAEDTLVRSTEIQNAGLARLVANAHKYAISFLLAFDIGDAPDLLPIALERSGLESQIRESLKGTNIANFKIYDVSGNTVFSLRQEDLGRNIASCGCFKAALDGQTVNELVIEVDDHPEPDGGFSHATGKTRENSLVGRSYALRLPRPHDKACPDASLMGDSGRAGERSMSSVYAVRVEASRIEEERKNVA